MLALLDFRIRQRDFLLEISRAITAQLDLSEVLRRVLNASVVMMAGQVGMIALRDGQGVFRVRAVLGIEAGRVSDLNQRLADLMATATENRDFEKMEVQLREMAQSVDERFQQAFALPLNIGGEPRGLLIVFRAHKLSATSDDVQVLQSFADQAAIAVQNAQLYERAETEWKRFSTIVQHSADGVMILDAGLRILSFNRALEKMTAWQSAEAIGMALPDVLKWSHLDSRDLPDALAGGWGKASEETLYVEGDLLRRDGLSLSVGIRYALLHNSDGDLVNIIANVRDITNFRQAQEMQNVFISTISHELKTPVALIKGHAATLRRDDVDWDDGVVREYSGVIEEEADRLTGLIENLLTASKLQAERGMSLNIGDVRLDQLAARSVERFQVQTVKHTFKRHFPKNFPAVPGDEVRLRQVIDNLIGNAIKYSPVGGQIEVGGSVEQDGVSVYVRDHGVGLTELDQERIFERFYRVDSALSRKTQGTGLGLYLAKAIVEAHGGTISVTSKPGQGSTFTLTLPYHPYP